MSALPAPLLVCERVSVRRGSRTTVADVGFSLDAGRVTSIIGPNGAGKSTLMQAVLGLTPIATGDIRLAGRSVRTLAPIARARIAAYVPQMQSYSPAFTVRDVVLSGRYAWQTQDAAMRGATAVDEALKLCALDPLAARRFDTLSGGERQKALLAAALAQEPALLCLDEPTTALDPAYQVELIQILRSCLAAGRAILLVSHDLDVPSALGGDVLALRDGRTVGLGPAAEMLTPERLGVVFGCDFERVAGASQRPVIVPRLPAFPGA